MTDSTKKGLKKVGRVFAGITEAGLEEFARKSRQFARDKKLSDEYRAKYAEMAESFDSFKEQVHRIKENIAGSCDIPAEDSEEPDSNESETYNVSPLEEPLRKEYFSEERSLEQDLKASSNDDFGNISISVWESKWIACGKLSEIDLNDIPNDLVGIIRLWYNNKIACIIRAIDLRNGGVRKKVSELANISKSQKGTVYLLIKEHFDFINLDILTIGGDDSSINICRNLERELIKSYNPIWM